MRLKIGKSFCLALVLLSSCRKDFPPKTEICQLDGFGGADCILKNEKVVYKAPSELKNYIARSPDDEAAFTAWCYDTSPDNVKQIWEQMKVETSKR